jgi:hypothetical protein
MPWSLRDDLHWCDCDGRAVFLDLKADRYFCLPGESNAAFLRLAHDEPQPGDCGRLDLLVRRGLLIESDARTAIQPPASVEPAGGEFPSDLHIRPSALSVIRAISREVLTAWLLRRRPFHQVIETVRCIGPTRSGPRGPHRSLQSLVSAAAVTALLLRSHDRCLVRGLALHWSCRRSGFSTSLVLGVIAHPFTAHCWVQLGSVVLIGGYEQARLYTPILVLE